MKILACSASPSIGELLLIYLAFVFPVLLTCYLQHIRKKYPFHKYVQMSLFLIGFGIYFWLDPPRARDPYGKWNRFEDIFASECLFYGILFIVIISSIKYKTIWDLYIRYFLSSAAMILILFLSAKSPPVSNASFTDFCITFC